MARIAGVNLPNQKRLEIGLTYIYGIGKSTSQKIIRELELDPEQKVRDLTDDEVTKLRNYIDGEVEAARRAGAPARRHGGHPDTLGHLLAAMHLDSLCCDRCLGRRCTVGLWPPRQAMERHECLIPPSMAYGDRGAGAAIKGGETLIFVVDLMDVR